MPKVERQQGPTPAPCLGCLISSGHRFGYVCVCVCLLNHIFLEGVGRRNKLGMDRNPAGSAWDADTFFCSFRPQTVTGELSRLGSVLGARGGPCSQPLLEVPATFGLSLRLSRAEVRRQPA